MRKLLSSSSSRFFRNSNYTVPEYRPSAARAPRPRIALVAPQGSTPTGERRS